LDLFNGGSLALKVLIVDPDETWILQAKKFLVEQLYEVSSVMNGRDAQLALYNEKYFAIFLNYETQNHSCLQVLKFIKTNYTSQRVIIVVNDKSFIETDEINEEKLVKLGATSMIVRPFDFPMLKDVLEGHQSLQDVLANLPKREGVSDEEEVSLTDDKFSSVKIDEFYSSQAMLFDVYIKLGTNKYLKILHMGDSFSKERIDKYKNEKKVEHLYFLNSDRRKFIQYNNFLAKRIIGNEAVPAFNKVTMLKNVAEKFIEESYTVGVKPQVIEQGKEICENVYQFIDSQKDLHTLLKSYQAFDPSAFSHAFLVTLYSTAIIKQFEWQSKSTIETTAMACMFHDIGKSLLPKEFVDLKVRDMSPEQLALYKTHPELGMKVVEGSRMINNSIKQIILQHHEAFDGTGFPYEKKGSKILTLANIVCLADDYVHIMLEDKMQPTEALRKILTDKIMVKRYNSQILEKFIQVFVDPVKVQRDQHLPSNSRLVNTKKIA